MNEITQMTRKEQVAHWVGVLCIAIGKGNFSDEVNRMMDFYQREAYERGVAQGKKEMAEMF